MITKQQLGNTLWGMAEFLYDKVEDYKNQMFAIADLRSFKKAIKNSEWLKTKCDAEAT